MEDTNCIMLDLRFRAVSLQIGVSDSGRGFGNSG